MNNECFVCGRSDVDVRLHWYVVLWHWVQEWICEACWDVETDEPREEGDW